MPSASPASQCGRTSLPSGRTWGAGSPQGRTMTLSSSPPTGTSGSAGVGGLRRGGGPRAPRIGPGLDRLADLLRDGVPLGLQPVRLPQQPAAALIERNRGVDRGGVLALVERALAQPRRIAAQALQPDAHAAAPAPAPGPPLPA